MTLQSSDSPSGRNQVDGLPPALSLVLASMAPASYLLKASVNYQPRYRWEDL